MFYYVSWSPKTGESTHTNCFLSEEERARYIRLLRKDITIHTWEFNPEEV